MLCHGKLDRSLFCMAGPKGLCYSRHLAEIAEEKSCTSFREMLSFSCIHIYFPSHILPHSHILPRFARRMRRKYLFERAQKTVKLENKSCGKIGCRTRGGGGGGGGGGLEYNLTGRRPFLRISTGKKMHFNTLCQNF